MPDVLEFETSFANSIYAHGPRIDETHLSAVAVPGPGVALAVPVATVVFAAVHAPFAAGSAVSVTVAGATPLAPAMASYY